MSLASKDLHVVVCQVHSSKYLPYLNCYIIGLVGTDIKLVHNTNWDQLILFDVVHEHFSKITSIQNNKGRPKQSHKINERIREFQKDI